MFNKLQEAVPSPVGPNETFLFRITMKYPKLLNLLVVALAVSLGVGGCRKKPVGVTTIPGMTGRIGGTNDTSGLITGTPPLATEQNPNVKPLPAEGVIPLGGRNLGDYIPNPERFAANTVYFEFDRATIKPSETSKIEDVAKYLQGNPTHAVQIDQPDRVFTISYGESRPAQSGHNEAAWSKNRRGVFVLLTPK